LTEKIVGNNAVFAFREGLRNSLWLVDEFIWLVDELIWLVEGSRWHAEGFPMVL